MPKRELGNDRPRTRRDARLRRRRFGFERRGERGDQGRRGSTGFGSTASSPALARPAFGELGTISGERYDRQCRPRPASALPRRAEIGAGIAGQVEQQRIDLTLLQPLPHLIDVLGEMDDMPGPREDRPENLAVGGVARGNEDLAAPVKRVWAAPVSAASALSLVGRRDDADGLFRRSGRRPPCDDWAMGRSFFDDAA